MKPTPVAEAANWGQRLSREMAAERKWRQQELDKQRKQKEKEEQQQQQQNGGVSPASTINKRDSSANRTAAQQQRDEIAEQSLARFPPRRDRTTLQPLGADRCCTMPQLPKHLLSRKAEHEYVAHHHPMAHSSQRPVDADVFHSVNQLEQSKAVAPMSATQAAVLQTTQRSGVGCTNFGRKPMIKSSFFRRFGGTNLVSDQ